MNLEVNESLLLFNLISKEGTVHIQIGQMSSGCLTSVSLPFALSIKRLIFLLQDRFPKIIPFVPLLREENDTSSCFGSAVADTPYHKFKFNFST